MSGVQSVADQQSIVQRRGYIIACANRLASICEGDNREMRSALDEVSWDELAQVPHWCLFERGDITRFQAIAGVLYIYPGVRNVIERDVLQQFRQVCGEEAFDAIRRQNISAESSYKLDDAFAVKEQVMMCGAGVLLATLPNKSLVAVFRGLIGEPIAEISAESAQQIYLLTSSIYQSLPAAAHSH